MFKISICYIVLVLYNFKNSYCSKIDVGDASEKSIHQEDKEGIDLTKHDSAKLLPSVCGVYNEARILGGLAANIYEFPWLALIAYHEVTADGTKNIKFGCGGTIINSRYILTSAECVTNKTIRGIRLGEYDINSFSDCQGEYPSFVCEEHLQDVAVEKEIAHENYQMNPIENNIALLRVKDEINFTYRNVRPICLPLNNKFIESNLSGKILTVAGWGITEYDQMSIRPLKVFTQVSASNTCDKILGIKIICVDGNGKDLCEGDNGGPLMIVNEDDSSKRMFQYGIMSSRPGKCNKLTSSPAIYTDVRKHMHWILDHIEE